MGVLIFVVALAFAVRSLTANFIRAHFSDPAWFQWGTYSIFDQQARGILEHTEPIFFISDPSRTDRIIYPPAYPLWVAVIYRLSGDWSPASVQLVQLILDSIAVLLLVGIGATAFNWRVGVAAGVIAALFPVLALDGASPTADAPTSWFVLAGVWLLIIAAKRKSIRFAIASGIALGIGCWFRVNPFLLFVAWSIALLVFLRAAWRQRILLSAAVALSTLLIISPVIVRNVTVFYPNVALTGLSIGYNLWIGIGETDRGPEFGAPSSDAESLEQDRKAMGLPPDAPLNINYPDGIRRDRQRARKALAVIRAHPFWYLGTVITRAAKHFKYAGAPPSLVGTVGFNVTAKKCLPPDAQNGFTAFVVNMIGWIQSVLRYLMLPLIIAGLCVSFSKDWRLTGILLATVLYYVATLAIGHSETRYGLPMQGLLVVFAGLATCAIVSVAGKRFNRAKQRTAEK